jgi:beta-glucosidase
MTRFRFRLLAGSSAVALATGVTALATTTPAHAAHAARAASDAAAATASCPWLNQSLPVWQRVNLLVPRMTLADKVSMATGQPGTSPAGAIGATPAIPSLCIPALSEEDGPLGVGDGLTGVTQLPASVAMSSAWDPALARQYGSVLGAEEHGKGMEVDYGPTINIQRDPRWGRNFEALTEDPDLNGSLAAAEIQGIQAQDVISEVKHFAVYNQETNRNTPQDDAIISDRTMHEIYLPGFYQATTKGGAGAVMCGYSQVNGQFDCQNNYLLNTLNQQWGYSGFVSSDYGATHSTADSANAGLDQDMPGTDGYYGAALQAAVADGQVPMATLDQMAGRILTEMFRFGFFNHQPTGTSASVVTSPAHTALAQTAAEQGTVLLKNDGSLLPLGAGTSSIAVIGGDGSTSPMSVGGGSAAVTASSVVSPLQGIQARAGSGVTVTSYAGTDPAQAAATAKAAQVAIVFADNFETEGADLSTISLQDNQDAYIAAVAAANPDTIVVLNTGGPVTMPWLGSVKGVLEAWYPGQQDGPAIAAVLFGDVNPGGHLPETFPASLDQVPASTAAQWTGVNGQVQYSEGLDVGYRWYDAQNLTPLFPFGYGLSYTSFTYSGLHVTPSVVDNTVSGPGASSCGCNGQSSRQVTVSATVTNTGTRAGSDVAQLYVGDPAVAGEPPRQLKGFQKVSLAPGQSRSVRFTLTGHDLSYWDDDANGWVLPDGGFGVYVGDSSALANLPLHGSFTAGRTVGARYATLSAPSPATPGSTVTATATFVNHGDYAVTGARYSLSAPAGWQVRPARPEPATVAAGQSVTVTFGVTVPESAQGTSATLTARLTGSGSPGARASVLAEATASEAVRALAAGTLSPASLLIQPGSSASATLTLSSSVAKPIGVQFSAKAPSGITVTPASGSVTVPAGPTGASVALKVSVAAGTAGGNYSVPISLTATDGRRSYPLNAVTLTVSVPYPSVSAAYDDVGITSDSATGAGAFDGGGDSFSEQALTAAGLAPGATVYQDGTTLTWPSAAAGTPDNVITDGQTIDLSGHGSSLVLLGSSNNGTGTGDLTVRYTDGTTQTSSISFPDWYSDAPVTGGGIVASTLHWNTSSGPGTQPVAVYSWPVPLDAAKTVASITLPAITPATSDNGELETHIFAAGFSSGSATVPFSSLSDAYNNVGIADASAPATANYDGGGYSFSEQALTAAGLAPGASVAVTGAAGDSGTVTWPSAAAGSLDDVVAEGQTIDLSGSGSSLVFVGAGNNGTASGTGTITYTDGSAQSFTLTLADWYADAPASGNQLVATAADWNAPAGSTLGDHPVSVYSDAVALAAGKTVQSVTLPDISHGIGDSLNGLHLFAWGVVG